MFGRRDFIRPRYCDLPSNLAQPTNNKPRLTGHVIDGASRARDGFRATPHLPYVHHRQLVMLLSWAVLAGCIREPVGAVCDLGTTIPSTSELVIASPSLDCITRTCLRVPLQQELPPGSSFPSGNSGLCTAECTSDDDCEGVPGSPCTGGFACSVPVTVGPFCCRKVCVCRDYGVFTEREACDPDNPDNMCRNLPGRS
jgi:hypothetical protein